MRRRGTVLLAGALALALFAAPAIDAKKKKKKKLGPVVTVSQTISVPPDAILTATATCPAGTELVGGGFASAPYHHSSGSNFVVDSHRVALRGWAVRAANIASVNGTLTSEAYCRKGAKSLVEATTTTTLPAAPGNPTQGDAVATCPAGQKAAAGGFSSTPAIMPSATYRGTLPFSSYRDSTATWRVSALNTAPAPRNFTSHVYCSPALRAERASADVNVSGASAPASVDSPVCPKVKVKAKKKGKKPKRKPTSALAGGFLVSPPVIGPGPANSRGVFVSESRRVNGVWHVGGISIGSQAGASTVRSAGYCG